MHLSRDDYLSPTSLGGKLRVPLAARMLLSVARDTDRGAGAGARPRGSRLRRRPQEDEALVA
jgi:hypothetical protein